ncbi:MAG: UvrD-helicase domain-containing protein [Clostridia bacterium]|nr:UvrD-helicase domain-containing protein [Clostridia bacterium]
MVDVNSILNKLNEAQVKPVVDTEGAVLVIAGAGSGKTRVLTSRIAYLILEKGVSPSEIVAITFTNKAAEEMKSRLSSMVGNIGSMWVSTIHSMCVKILRRDIDKLGYDTNFSIYDEQDKDKALKRIFDQLGYDVDKLLKPVKHHISNAKNECLTPEEYSIVYADVQFIDEIVEVYKAYERQLKTTNSLDFDDLLFKTYVLFKEFPFVADDYAERFKYVHIDEFQDTNTVQFSIVQRLATKHGNIFVVGDDDQSIYGWRGAKVENILRFDEKYVGAKIYKLEQNYRSTKKILNLANTIIANNKERREKELWTENGDGVKIETFIGGDENSEASFVATQIKTLMSRTNLNYSDFAVFMRVNAISRAFEQEFTKYGIPYKVFGGFRFFERKEIKDVLAYLKIIANPLDDEAFLRAISFPKRGVGEKTLTEIKEYCSANYISITQGIERIDETDISSSAKNKLVNFNNLIKSFRGYSNVLSVVQLIDKVLEVTDFLKQFEEDTEENVSRKMNIDELKNTAEQFAKENEGAGLREYLSSVTLSSDIDDINDGNAVTVATIHAVKGLEYKVVFIAGLDEKILPISRSFDDDEDMEEERRLMYVAITRAQERLYLTRAKSRYMYGKRDFMMQSRFIKEGASALGILEAQRQQPTYNSYSSYNDEDLGYSSNNSGYSSSYAKSMLSSNKPTAKANNDFSKYKKGAFVKHVKFGVGTIIEVIGSGDNMLVNVSFQGFGNKLLAVKFAPLEFV